MQTKVVDVLPDVDRSLMTVPLYGPDFAQHTQRGYPTLIRRNRYGVYCWYVGVHRDHPWFGCGEEVTKVVPHVRFVGRSTDFVLVEFDESDDPDVWWIGQTGEPLSEHPMQGIPVSNLCDGDAVVSYEQVCSYVTALVVKVEAAHNRTEPDHEARW